MIHTIPRRVFRLYDPNGKEGLWYTSDKTRTNKINKVLPDKDIPMDRSEVYSTNNKEWRSSACSLSQLSFWFSLDEVTKLILNGFLLGEFAVSEWIDLPHGEVIFSEGKLERVINIADISG